MPSLSVMCVNPGSYGSLTPATSLQFRIHFNQTCFVIKSYWSNYYRFSWVGPSSQTNVSKQTQFFVESRVTLTRQLLRMLYIHCSFLPQASYLTAPLPPHLDSRLMASHSRCCAPLVSTQGTILIFSQAYSGVKSGPLIRICTRQMFCSSRKTYFQSNIFLIPCHGSYKHTHTSLKDPPNVNQCQNESDAKGDSDLFLSNKHPLFTSKLTLANRSPPSDNRQSPLLLWKKEREKKKKAISCMSAEFLLIPIVHF